MAKLTDTLSQTDNKQETQDKNIYNQIFDAILGQRLLPGTKLVEEELAGIFKVSRTIIRRALLRLSQDCIVDIKPNKGASVACPTVAQAREIMQARRMIEAQIVREAVNVIDENQLTELRELVAEEQSSVENNVRDKGIRLSGDFHLHLAKFTGNTTLTKFIRELTPQTSLIIARYEKPGYANCSHVEHLELIDVIASGDSEKAVELMNQHITHIEQKLGLNDIDNPVELKDIFSQVG